MASSRDIYEVEIRSNLASVLSDFRQFKSLLATLGGDLERFGAAGTAQQRGTSVEVEQLRGVAGQKVAAADIQRLVTEQIIGGIRNSLRGGAALSFLDPTGKRDFDTATPQVRRLGKALDDLFNFIPKFRDDGTIHPSSQAAIERRRTAVYQAADAGLGGRGLTPTGQARLDALLDQARLQARQAVDRYTAAYNQASGAVIKYSEAAFKDSPEGAAAALDKQRQAALQKQAADEFIAAEKEAARLQREQNEAVAALDRQRRSALAKQVAEDAKAATAPQESLERQRAAGQAKQVAAEYNAQQKEALRQERADNQAIARLRADRRKALEQINFDLKHGTQGGYLDPSKVDAARQPLYDLSTPHEPETSRAALARAEAQEALVLSQITGVGRRRYSTEAQVTAAEDRLLALQIQLQGVIQRRMAAEERVQAETGGFQSQFLRGFRGASDRPYAEQLGQAVKFSAFYGAAYRIQAALLQTFQNALQQGIEFEQGLTDLSIATGQTKDEVRGLATDLASTAANAGIDPAKGVTIGARAVGLYGLAGSSDAGQQAFVARLSTDIVGKLAIGGKADPVDVQANLAAITQALGLGATGQIRVADLDAYFSKRFGSPGGGTLEAAAQSASVGTAAGFSLEEIQALAAQAIARTGQSPNAIGGYLAQIFSRGGEGSLTGVAGRLGIDTNGVPLRDVFAQLAKQYNDPRTRDTTQAEISAAFGRGKVQNAVVAILESFDRIEKEAKKAEGGAAEGATDRQFAARINNIGGELSVFGAHLKEAALLFGQSGLLSGLGEVIFVLDHMVVALNSVLQLFAALPEPLKLLLGTLVAARAASALGVTGAVASRLAPTVLAAGSLRGGVAALGIGALTSPLGLAIGGLLAVAAMKSAANKVSAALNDSAEAVQSGPQAVGATAAAYRNYASTLREQASKDRKTSNVFTDIFGGGSLDSEAKQLDARAKRVADLAKRIQVRDEARLAQGTSGVTGFDSDSLKSSLDAVTAAGGTSVQRLNTLESAILGLGKTSAEAAKALNAIDFQEFGTILAATPLKGKITYGTGASGGGFTGVNVPVLDPSRFPRVDQLRGRAAASLGANTGGQYAGIAGDLITRALTNKERTSIQNQVSDADLQKILEGLGITDYTQITPAIASQAAGTAASKLKAKGGIRPENLDTIKAFYQKWLTDAILEQAGTVREQILGKTSLNTTEVTGALENLRTEASGNLDKTGEHDYAKKAQILRSALTTARQIAKKADVKDLPIVLESISDFEAQVVQNQIDRLQAIRVAAVAAAKTQEAATAIGRKSVAQQIRIILANIQNPKAVEQLIGVLNTAAKGTVAVVRGSLETMLFVAEMALAAAKQAVNPFLAELGVPGALDGVKAAQAKVDAINKALAGLQYVTGDASPDQIDTGGSSSGPTDTAAQIAAARRAARAARGGDTVRIATAAVAVAKADLDAAKKGTVEYYNALASYYQAQDELTQAYREYGHIRNLLRIDQTDPVAVATLALREAQRKLRVDRRKGKGASVIAQDQLDIRNAQTEREDAAFQQRLSDYQTNDQLGRITHAAYLRYLNNEHDRLQAIAHRTRQQQDELNQIDSLLQEATKSMQGAFNIGDIKLPTPYEVRRFIQQQARPLSADSGYSPGANTTIYINGADTGKVKEIITDVVGQGTRVITTTPRRT